MNGIVWRVGVGWDMRSRKWRTHGKEDVLCLWACCAQDCILYFLKICGRVICVGGIVLAMNGNVCRWRIRRWVSLVKCRRIMNTRWIRVGYEVLRMDLICRWKGRYTAMFSCKIVNQLIKRIWIHGCQTKSDERFDDRLNMNLGLGAILDFVGLYADLVWIGLHLIWFDWIWLNLIWCDIDIEFDWIWYWYDID